MSNLTIDLKSKKNKLLLISGAFFVLLPFIACLGFNFYWGNSFGHSFKMFARSGALYPLIILFVIGVISLYSLIYDKLMNHNLFFILSFFALIISIIFFMRGYYLSDINFINLFGSYRISYSFVEGFLGPLTFHLTFIISFICSYFLYRIGQIIKMGN